MRTLLLVNYSDLCACYEDVFELDVPKFHHHRVIEIIKDNPNWTQYNPNKPNIRREGLSVTSLDGGMSGYPDLHSLIEYAQETKTKVNEADFNQKTPILDELPEFEELVDLFQEDTGRCHFIRMPEGGFFPPHRDNGFTVPMKNFRVVVPLVDVTENGPFVWLLDGKPINMTAGRTYFVNTSKAHSLFSMCNTFYLFVMNITCSQESIQRLLFNSKIR